MTTTHSTRPDDLDTFETALLAELRTTVADRRPARRMRVLTFGGVAAAAAATLGVSLVVGGSSPAFAVHQQADGDVVVTINRLDDSAGLESALAAQGVAADVDYNHPLMLKSTDGKTIAAIPLTGTPGSPARHPNAKRGAAVVQFGSSGGDNVDCSFGKGGYVTLDAVDGGYVVKIPGASVLGATRLQITTAMSGDHGTLAVSYHDGRCIQFASPSK